MRIGRLTMVLLLAFCGAFWIGLSAQVPQQTNQAETRRIDVPLAPAGAWTPTGLNVAQGDRLRFEARPADDNSRALMANLAASFPPSFTARIGQEVFPFTPGREVVAPVGGDLSVAVTFPDQIPQTRWPPAVMHIEHEPQVIEIVTPPEANNLVEANNFADNAANNILEENNLAGPDDNAATTGGNLANNGATLVDNAPPGDWRWLVPLLIGAGGMLALLLVARLVKQALRPKRLPALSVGVHPSLDRDEGGVTGDEIALAGPEVRLRTALEPGGTFFDGGEPMVEREERDG